MIELGILVVYLVPEENERLLELHLRQIGKHTRVPYTIFGCATRVSAKARAMLEAHPGLSLCECQGTDVTGRAEHAHYLDQLARAAIDAGVTHVVTLHVDSFPVRSDWVETLVSRLSERSEFVVADPTYTACMMFTRAFYLRCKPAFQVTAAERSSPDYVRFMAAHNPSTHSGVGYLFRAYLEGSAGHREQYRAPGLSKDRIGELYDDVVFHLGRAAYVREPSLQPSRPRGPGGLAARYAVSLARTVVPPSVRRGVSRRLRWMTGRFFDAASHELWRNRVYRAMDELVADPERYVACMREEARS